MVSCGRSLNTGQFSVNVTDKEVRQVTPPIAFASIILGLRRNIARVLELDSKNPEGRPTVNELKKTIGICRFIFATHFYSRP